jgi:hypothetical protein
MIKPTTLACPIPYADSRPREEKSAWGHLEPKASASDRQSDTTRPGQRDWLAPQVRPRTIHALLSFVCEITIRIGSHVLLGA